jgi:hypothetical protein
VGHPDIQREVRMDFFPGRAEATGIDGSQNVHNCAFPVGIAGRRLLAEIIRRYRIDKKMSFRGNILGRSR